MGKFLIVDDNLAMAENLAEILVEAGHEAIPVSSGARALDLVQTVRFDALVSDMRMPEMNGAEVVRRGRLIDAGLPALIISAYSEDQLLEHARHFGLLCILPKPVPIALLLELLGHVRRNGVVAVIEDNRPLAENWSEILRKHGFGSVIASTVAETEALGDVSLFAAIVDLRMPGGPDGESMRRLRARFPSLPMLVTTGYNDVVCPVVAVATFLKPCAPTVVLERLEQLHGNCALS